MPKRFIKTLLIMTVIYVGWLLMVHLSSQGMKSGPDATPSQSTAEPMPYEDLAAAYEQLQQQLQKADSTHLIRRYHGRHALFSAERVFDEKVMAASRDYFASQLGRKKIFLDLPEFDWSRDDEARPVDVLRLTFRGNGLPDNVEQLAKSGLLEPKLHAFYSALIQQNSVLWTRPEASVHFAAVTSNGELYRARSTPFITVQRLSKDYFAKMQAASLPFLWNAYVDEDKQRESQRALLNEPHGPPDLIGPRRPAGWQPPPEPPAPPEPFGPNFPRTKAQIMASYGDRDRAPEPQGPFIRPGENILDSLPAVADAMREQQQLQRPSVNSFSMDERTVERLFEQRLAEQSDSLSDTLEWRKAINTKRQKEGLKPIADKHLDRLSRLDPEFMTLFLINNLFEQYNIFSVFDEDVYLTINALDTRMNVLYVSYNLRFDPIAPDDWPEEDIPAGCGERPVNISDEFFLIAAKPYSYLVRVYLPSCELDLGDYSQIDHFLSEMRILH